MNILNRKLVRDLWQSRGQFISVLIIVTIGVMFYTGMNSGYRNISGASGRYYEDYRFADLWATFYKASEGVEQKVETLPFVAMATGRVVQDVNISMSGENAVIRLITLPDVKKDIVNDIVLQSGSYFSDAGSNQCLVEAGFFKAHNLKIGDYISPVINGSEVKLKVAGSVINPEYVYAVKDASELIADSQKFGVVYIKKSFGQAVLGFRGSVNSLSMTVREGTDIEKAKKDVETLLKRYGATGVTDRDSQVSFKLVDEKIKGYQSLGSSFPVIFFIVAAVIIYITMGRMVENQKQQIGVLKAFGFTNLQVLAHYLSFSAFIAILGSILGSVVGLYLGMGFTMVINMYFSFPGAKAAMYPDLVLPASLLTLFFCLLAGYNACKKAFSITPSQAMRPRAPMLGKKILAERVGALWKSLSYSWKMILRNIFRYKRRALLTSIGVIFASSMTVIALGLKDSVDYMVNQQYTNIQNYDLKVNFARFLSPEELARIRNIPHIVEFEPVVETGVEISNGWRSKQTALTALISDPKMYRVVDDDGNPLALPDNGILVPDKLARAIGAEVGDTVSIKSLLPGKEKQETRIRGTLAQYLGTSAYSSMENINRLLGEGSVANSAVIRLDGGGSEKEVVDTLKGMPAVGSVQSKSDVYNNLVKNLAPMTAEIGIIIVLASVLSIAVIYNIASISIFERQRELATMKVLGFKDSEVRKLIFNENYIITAVGILVGLPLGNWMGVAMMASYETDAYTFPFILSKGMFAVAAVLTLMFTFIANLTLMKKIRTISMVEVLKSAE